MFRLSGVASQLLMLHGQNKHRRATAAAAGQLPDEGHEEEGNKTKWEHLRRSSRSLGAPRGRAQGLRKKKLLDEKMHNSPNIHCKKYSVIHSGLIWCEMIPSVQLERNQPSLQDHEIERDQTNSLLVFMCRASMEDPPTPHGWIGTCTNVTSV